MARSQFSKVIFDIDRDVLPAKTDVECPFEVTDSLLEASNWDWVGLFQVGWRSQKDYFTYEYLTLPPEYQKGRKFFSRILFSANNLPTDEEYYQFCYISRQLNTICGASSPFQFRTSSGKEYVEEECDDMMIIRDKKDVMKDEIQKLGHKLLLLTRERDELQEKLQMTERSVAVKDKMITQLQTEVCTLENIEDLERNRVIVLEGDMGDLRQQIKELAEEKQNLMEDIHHLQLRTDEVQGQIASLKGTIRSLESERDELSGQNQGLMNELDTYKSMVTDSQSKAAKRLKAIDKLNKSLEKAQNQCATVVEECEELKKKAVERENLLQVMEENVAQLLKEKMEVERKRGDLTHELMNANDKLLAFDDMKIRLGRDLEAYELTQQTMSDKCENQESEMHCMQERLEQKSKECSELRQMLTAKVHELEEKGQALSNSEETLKRTLKDAKEHYMDQQLLENHLMKVKNECCETHRQMDVVKAQMKVMSDEKTALQMQLRSFEDELQETLVLKDKEVAAKVEELKDQIQRMEERDLELAQKNERICFLEGEICKLMGDIKSQSEDLRMKTYDANDAEQNLICLQHTNFGLTDAVSSLTRERDQSLKKYNEVAAELENQQKQWQEDEAARYCLWQANESLKTRLEAKEKELEGLKLKVGDLERTMDIERQAKKKRVQEVEELKLRLEIGEVEFRKQMQDNQMLQRQLKKDVSYYAFRAEGSEASSPDTSVSDTETGDVERKKKYKQMYKAQKVENETLRDMMKLQQKWTDESITKLKKCLSEKEECMEQLHSEINMLKAQKKEEDELADGEDPEQVSEEEEHEQVSEEEEHEQVSEEEEQEQVSEEEEPEQVSEEEEHEEDSEEEEHEDSDEEEQEEVSDEVKKAKLLLMYGNPYNQKRETASEHLEQQAIIRSTLEEEVESTADPMVSAPGEGQQLPPPLQPEVLGAVAAAASADDLSDDSAVEEGPPDTFEDCLGNIPEDSFLDAIGEGMKICPFCQASVLATSDFEEHVATHFGRICPVCRSQADDAMSPQDFEQHVNKCLDRESASAPPNEESSCQ